MARRPRDAKLDSRTARLKLKPRREPYWRVLQPGQAIGYRRLTGGRNGTWIARRNTIGVKGSTKYQALGPADDYAEADGKRVFDFVQAIEQAKNFLGGDGGPGKGSLAPVTLRQAVLVDHVAFLKAERKSGDGAEKSLKKHMIAHLADALDKPVADLTTAQLEKFKRGMVRKDPDDPEVERRSKDTANRVLNDLRAGLNRAFQDEKNRIPSDAAWRRVKPFKNVGRARQVHLDVEQVKRLLAATSGAFLKLVTGALLTGARPPHELVALRVRDFSPTTSTLTVIDGKTGHREITLTQEAVTFFGGLCEGREPDALLLPKGDGTAWGKNHHIRPMRDAVEKAKLPEDCTIYALRHTYASQSILAGMNLKLLAENMGTSVRMLEVHYGKFIAASRRKLVEETAFKLGLGATKGADVAVGSVDG